MLNYLSLDETKAKWIRRKRNNWQLNYQQFMASPVKSIAVNLLKWPTCITSSNAINHR